MLTCFALVSFRCAMHKLRTRSSPFLHISVQQLFSLSRCMCMSMFFLLCLGCCSIVPIVVIGRTFPFPPPILSSFGASTRRCYFYMYRLYVYIGIARSFAIFLHYFFPKIHALTSRIFMICMCMEKLM